MKDYHLMARETTQQPVTCAALKVQHFFFWKHEHKRRLMLRKYNNNATIATEVAVWSRLLGVLISSDLLGILVIFQCA